MTGSTETGRRHSARPWRLVVLSIVLLLAVVAVWLAFGLRSAAARVQSNASAAQSSLEKAKSQLVAGDLVAASASAARAQQEVADAADAAEALPVRAAGILPVIGGAVDDLDLLVSAAGDLASASSRVVDVYAAATGGAGAGSLFSGGRADFSALDSARASVDESLALATRAQQSLQAVEADVPGTGALAEARDSALSEVRPLVEQLEVLSDVFGRLPDALGRASTKNYLLVIQNPAELFAGGGAALSAAVLRFAGGRMTLPVSGSVSGKLFPGNPRKAWDHESGAPYFPRVRQPVSFALTSLHPDFAKTSVEMQRGWVANGREPVDGVIMMDPVALQMALRVTGPIRSEQYGSITADNLVQKLLVDAYVDFDGDPEARHRVNDALIASFTARLTSGQGLLALARALASTAPGGHFRVSVVDPQLNAVLASTDLGGGMPSAAGRDGLAVFSQNNNGSKVDIFQRRTITHDVTVGSDGSAEVTTTVSATYETPTDGRPQRERTGYLTPWAANWYMVYVPRAATGVTVVSPRNDRGDIDDPSVYPDGDGWSVVRVRRWTAAGDTARITVNYRLPRGTFISNGDVTYSLATSPQPVLLEPTATITVRGPGTASVSSTLPGSWTSTGGEVTWSGAFNRISSTSVHWS